MSARNDCCKKEPQKKERFIRYDDEGDHVHGYTHVDGHGRVNVDLREILSWLRKTHRVCLNKFSIHHPL